MSRKITFWSLYDKFRTKVIKHFIITTPYIICQTILGTIASKIFENKILDKNSNYAELLPDFLQVFFGNLGKIGFFLLGIVLASLFALFFYFNYLKEEELAVRGGHYTKNLLLTKFRRLTFEQKRAKKDELRVLVESDSANIGWYWEHIPNHIYHSILAIVLVLLLNYQGFFEMGRVAIIFSIAWLLLVNFSSYYLTKLVIKGEEKHKKALSKEWKIINKEINQANLITGMGLDYQYQTQQRQITKQNQDLLISFNHTKALSRTIPVNWLVKLFPPLLLVLSSKFVGSSLLIIWLIFTHFADIFTCVWDYGDYASSRRRINAFLSLPEKNDNLSGIKLAKSLKLKSVTFANVSFRYHRQSAWILKRYNRQFTIEKLNRLTGKNGTGKSTILYLLLGMITPQAGKIIIEYQNGLSYELHKDINLKAWRENNAAYCTHDTLLEKGSTGQRQLVNIKQVLTSKKDCQIFLFDEADNALDKDNQKDFQETITELAKHKIVVYIKH